jgi:hypothetical protein
VTQISALHKREPLKKGTRQEPPNEKDVAVTSLHFPRRSKSRLLLLFREKLEPVVKSCDDLRLGDAEARRGRDVARPVLADGRVLTTRATDRQSKGLCDRLGLLVRAVPGEVGQGDVHRRAHSSAEVCGARRDVAVVGRLCKLQTLDSVDHVECLAR